MVYLQNYGCFFLSQLFWFYEIQRRRICVCTDIQMNRGRLLCQRRKFHLSFPSQLWGSISQEMGWSAQTGFRWLPCTVIVGCSLWLSTLVLGLIVMRGTLSFLASVLGQYALCELHFVGLCYYCWWATHYNYCSSSPRFQRRLHQWVFMFSCTP